jgi:3',5'-cyclic AMP phosphodiesterase CpdA
MLSPSSSRRQFLHSAVVTSSAALVGATLSTPLNATPLERKRVLRIAHFTDVHVQPERGASEGMAACLRHISALQDKPDVLFNGGDAIFDGLEQNEQRTQLQWDIFFDTLKRETKLPVRHCIGNHDVWGWLQDKSGAKGNEARYGKKWAVEVYGMPNRYYSFAQAGWHFIVLDSTQSRGNIGYEARLDSEQYEWLRGELASVKPTTPVLVMSHIPILSMTSAFFLRKQEHNSDWTIQRNLMHADGLQIQQLFRKYPNVKVCLSGHTHLVDRLDYTGVTYFCDGAVSGAWWKGAWQDCEPGYALVNLYDDGTFEREYVVYGWKPKE